MQPKELRFRQVHLDFHTSPHIEAIGVAFDKKAWQEALQAASVDSITCFSKCHHGLSYHPTTVGVQHPHLSFDLLRAQMDACLEVGIKVPIYLSAGVDNTITQTHPEWREMDATGRIQGWTSSPLDPGFHSLCFNSPYLDYLCRQIEEAVILFPEADGVFLDITSQGPCCCNWCMREMARNGLDPKNEAHRKQAALLAMERYYQASTAACKIMDASMPVVHNAGHVSRSDRHVLAYHSHLELESLPTGGWGYDHFPESATYASNLGLDYLGMTGKFHLSWGEFGGFKHPNALRYECAAMNAYGAKCSIGDQLHPDGHLDVSTYELIGASYSEVAAREPWCKNSVAVADIAILSSEAENGRDDANSAADTGAIRILLEGHQLFTLIDRQVEFGSYKLLILPDNIAVDDELKVLLDAYLAQGGKLLISGRSGLFKPEGAGKEEDAFAFDIGADFFGQSPFSPDYILPAPAYRASFVSTPSVAYAASQRIKVTNGESLGQIFDPYFNRTYQHFCSHLHAPCRPEPSGYDLGVRHGNLVYLAHPVFTLYRKTGAVAHKEHVLSILNALLGDDQMVRTNLPSGARLTLRRQPFEKRQVIHLLFANKQTRGGIGNLCGGPSSSVEVIEELDPIRQVTIALRSGAPIVRATLEPGGIELPYHQNNGWIELSIDSLVCSQLVVLHE